MNKTLLCVSLFLLTSLFCCYAGLNHIEKLGFSVEGMDKINKQLNKALFDHECTHLDFSNIGTPRKINHMLRIIYFFLYPKIDIYGHIKNEDFPHVSIRSIDLSGNELRTVPQYLFDFPDLRTVDFTGNNLFSWCEENLRRSPGNISFSL